MTTAETAEPVALKAARAYVARGLRVFPLVDKVPALANPHAPGSPERTTCKGECGKLGHGLYDATDDDTLLAEWFGGTHRWNIGIAVPLGVVVIDIDPRNGGTVTLDAWKAEHGDAWFDIPPRSATGGGGHHLLYTRPAGKLRKNPGVGVDLLWEGKYIVAPPSETIDAYRWRKALPASMDELPTMPSWMEVLCVDAVDMEAIERTLGSAIIVPSTRGGNDDLGNAARAATSWGQLLPRHAWHLVSGDGDTDGSRWRHPSSDNKFSATVRHGCLFVFSPNTPFPVTDTGNAHGVTLFSGLQTLDHHGDLQATVRRLRTDGYLIDPPDLLDELRARGIPVEVTVTTEPIVKVDASRFVSGWEFAYGTDEDMIVRWGTDTSVLWAKGESLLLAGPTGVGKTTLMLQLVAGLIGITVMVLERPVLPAERVLYLAMDRPAQIRRAMRRYFTAAHEAPLTDRLLIWPGPLPVDLLKNTELLVQLAHEAKADTIVIDSLKDVALNISSDETGGAINRAIQACNAQGIDVLSSHHQRKRGGGKDSTPPKTIDDVYGSNWLTAGAGSVLLLWGQAGDEAVDLIHLKSPANPVGPWKLVHDHVAGTTTFLVADWDSIAYLNIRGENGASVSEAAHARFARPIDAKDAKWKSTERLLRDLVAKGYAHSTSKTVDAETGQIIGVRYAIGPSIEWAERPAPRHAPPTPPDMPNLAPT